MCVLSLAQPFNQPHPPTLTRTAAYHPVAPVTHEAAANLQKIHALVKAEMATVQYRHAEAYDKGRCPAHDSNPVIGYG